MKSLVFVVIACLACVYLGAAQVGKITFFVGEVLYRANQNQAYKGVIRDMLLAEDGFLKTGPDSSVEVLWLSGGTVTIESNRQVSIRKLFEEASSKQNWKNRLESKVGNLKLQSKRRASTTAGIRRDEAEVKRDSLLFWSVEPMQDILPAIDLFEGKQYLKAIPLFEAVIQQAPLKKDAELSHAYLILIYDAIGDTQKLKKQVEVLKQDFPRSTILDSLPQD
jgi:hypothetical protein